MKFSPKFFFGTRKSTKPFYIKNMRGMFVESDDSEWLLPRKKPMRKRFLAFLRRLFVRKPKVYKPKMNKKKTHYGGL